MTAARASNLRGIALMAGGMFLFSAGDTMAKYLTGELHPVQVAWSRQLGLLLAVLFLLATRGRGILRTETPLLQISRGVLAAGSAVFFIMAIMYVPLADAVAVSFVAPFIVTILGAVILREPVGIRRWVAVAVGFAGAMIIIRPGFGEFHPAIALVFVAASMFALRQILSRVLSGRDRTVTTVAYTAITASILLSLPLPFVWRTPEHAWQFGLLFGIAGLAAIGETMVIRALELAQAVALAPVHYSLIIWATFYGWLVFGQLPDAWTWTGTTIIVATGIYVLYRERLARAR